MTSLCIGHLQASDVGDYTLTLENPFGKVSLSIHIDIIGKVINKLKSIEVSFTSAQMRCKNR